MRQGKWVFPMVLFLAGLPAKADDAGQANAAGQPAKTVQPELDMAREIAWAKRRWPGAFSAVRFDSLAPKLMEWVPKGKTRMGYLGGTCEPVRLTREEGPTGERLEGRVFEKPTRDNGRLKRRYRILNFAHEYRVPCVGGEEIMTTKHDRGSDIGWACGEADRVRGVLSYVDRKVAKFTGESVSMAFTCRDSVSDFRDEATACGDGCAQCASLGVMARASNEFLSTPHGYPPKQGTDDSSQRESDYARLLRLENARKAWRVRPSSRLPKTDPPILYRNQADCLRMGRKQ